MTEACNDIPGRRDDDPNVHELVERNFGSEFSMMFADNGEKGIEIAQATTRYCVARHFDAWQRLVPEIKSDDSLKNLPVIVISMLEDD